MKKITIVLALAFSLFSLSVSAWAAPTTRDLSFTVNTESLKPCTTTSKTNSECPSGITENSLLDCLKSFGCQTGTTAAQDCSLATPSCYTSPEDLLNCYGLYIPTASADDTGDVTEATDAEVSTVDSTCETATAQADASSADTQASEQEISNESAQDETICAPAILEHYTQEADAANTAAAACDSAASDGAKETCVADTTTTAISDDAACDATGEACETQDSTANNTCLTIDAEALSNSGASLFDFLNSFLKKCGIPSDIFSFFMNTDDNQSDSQTEEPTPEPSDNAAETPAQSADPTPATTPSDTGSETPLPSDSADETPVPSSNIDNLSYEEQVVALVNEQRAAYGLDPLTLNTELSNVARVKSQDMHDNNYFSHTSPTYGSPFEMMTTFGISYRTAGENIAMGYATPQTVVNAWMNSEGHRANILNSAFTQIGVGYVADGNYWTQEFIG